MKSLFTASERLEKRLQEIETYFSDLGLEYHHSSVSRGYESVKRIRKESYKGKFGEGYILHLPTIISNVRGNSFHQINYYVKK